MGTFSKTSARSKKSKAQAKAEFISTNSNRVSLMLIANNLRKVAGLRADHITGRTFLNAILAADLIDHLATRWPNVVSTNFPQLERFVAAVIKSLNKAEGAK